MTHYCPHIKRDGTICNNPHGFQFDNCANHRVRPAAGVQYVCTLCGLTTTRTNALCSRKSCPGFQEYCKIKNAAKRASLDDRRAELIEKSKPPSVQDEIDLLETKLAVVMEQVDKFRAHIDTLKATL